MDKEIIQLYNDINKMLKYLDYDKGEMAQLQFQIDYRLEIDTSKFTERTLLDRLMRFSMWRSENRIKQLRNRKFKHIRKAIKYNDDAYLYNACYNNTSIFELRQYTADSRYDLKELLNESHSYLIVGTIVDAYRFMSQQWTELKTIAEMVKTHLEHKYANEIKLSK